MALIQAGEREAVHALAALLDCNPFVPERVALERRALGSAFVPVATVWHAQGAETGVNPNTARLHALAEHLAAKLRRRLSRKTKASAAALEDYRGLVLSLLWLRYEDAWWGLIDAGEAAKEPVAWYSNFARDVQHFFSPLRGAPVDAAHLFALGFQARRAFHHIYRKIFGGSQPAVQLRAAVWESIFTEDVRAYREEYYDSMADIPSLIIGESGTGKELVARAIALSRYLPFDARTQRFAADPAAVFCAVNLSALSPTLIESELFGHRLGAFTGAVEERRGWLESCGAYGAVFLDEIGELSTEIQIKLLRVLESRQFHRVGESTPRSFGGKLIAATHQDLEQLIRAGSFRRDLYFRIHADVIRTPSLREQLADRPEDLGDLVRILADRIPKRPAAAERLAGKVVRWVEKNLGPDYPWHGNMRQLGHCVRSILVHGTYTPPAEEAQRAITTAHRPAEVRASTSPRRVNTVYAGAADDAFLEGVRDGTLTAAEILEGYCARVRAQAGNSYKEAASRLDLNWKTVRARVRAWKERG